MAQGGRITHHWIGGGGGAAASYAIPEEVGLKPDSSARLTPYSRGSTCMCENRAGERKCRQAHAHGVSRWPAPGPGSGITQTAADGRYLNEASNLSDLDSAATARTNLGLGTAAVQPSSAFLTTDTGDGRYLNETSNLSDLPNAATARTNLGLDNVATLSDTAPVDVGATAAAGSATDAPRRDHRHQCADRQHAAVRWKRRSWSPDCDGARTCSTKTFGTTAQTRRARMRNRHPRAWRS